MLTRKITSFEFTKSPCEIELTGFHLAMKSIASHTQVSMLTIHRPSATERKEMWKRNFTFCCRQSRRLICIPILRHDFEVIWQWRSSNVVHGIAIFEKTISKTTLVLLFRKLERNVNQNIELYL